MRYAVIIAGGAGTRLWPMSRSGTPKQLLKFIEGHSLLNIAAARTRGLIEPNNLYICTGSAYRRQVLDDLVVLPESQIIGEPMGRDTANACGLAAAVLYKRDADAAMAILTADHIIEPISTFQNALTRAFETVEQYPEYLVTFGIKPSYAATGYGYVQQGEALTGLKDVYAVKAFKEKPKKEIAEQYVESGDYAWNSGMFVWKARTLLEQLKQHLPESYAGLMKIAEAWGTPDQEKVLGEIYPTLPKISIDFAIMEKAPRVATIAMDIRWLDVGSWPSYGDTLEADHDFNRSGNAKSVHLDSSNILVANEGDPDYLVATIGCKDLLIIHTPVATLVCPADQAERIKQLVAEVEKKLGKKYV